VPQTSANSSTAPVLTLIGPLPEPKGGISIHIQRLGRLLEDDFRVRYIDESRIIKPDLYNIRSRKIFPYIQLIRSSDIVHIQSSLTILRCFHLLMAKLFRKRAFVTIHSIWGKSAIELFLIRLMLKLADRVITVNEEIAEKLKPAHGVVQPAFIPPSLEIEPELPEQISAWLAGQKKQSRKIIAANAFRIELHEGKDLYGIDISIEMMRRLIHDEGLHVSMIFIISSLDRAGTRLDEYLQLIKKWDLEDHVLLTCANLSFVKLINDADIVLRPTCTDGDALTIREALYLDKPIIASDVVARPGGTTTFRNRDLSDLCSKIIALTKNQAHTHKTTEGGGHYRDFYKNFYDLCY
jgi:glycosyltransferase involved in cell wall biosynthesis